MNVTRELIAYALIVTVLVVVVPLAVVRWRRRKLEKLRRRGIKRHGH